MSLPEFNVEGNLPAGIHAASWVEIRERFGRTPHRQKLVRGLKAASTLLQFAGCRRLYVDGSFVTEKLVPNDYDAAWEPEGVDIPLLLMAEPVFADFSNGRAAQKAKFGGELFPTSARGDQSGRTFLKFFQIDKESGNPKGIVVVDLRESIDD